MRTSSRWVLVVGALLALPPGLHGASAEAEPAQAGLRPCSVDGITTQVLCTRIEVPRSRTDAALGTLFLEVTVVPARYRRAAPDPLFLLAGGPGQGARSYGRLAVRGFSEVNQRRDIVLVDLRGTGDSSRLACPTATSDPLAQLGADAGLSFDAAGCLAGLEEDPRNFGAVEQVADLEAVRRALGYGRINLWGGSYGTRTALWYARAFPESVRAVVLDGAVPPEVRFPSSVPVDGQASLERLFADCAADPTCRAAFPGLPERFAALLARLEAAPAEPRVIDPLTGAERRITVSRAGFAQALRVALYVPEQASLIPWTIVRAEAGDFGPAAALAAAGASWSTETMALGSTLTILCSEDLPRLTAFDLDLADGFLGRAAIEPWQSWCAHWPRAEPPPGLDEVRPLTMPALILSGVLDPVTPPRWGEVMRQHFVAATHLTVPGGGHNVSFLGCMPQLVARFLDQGNSDGLDATCLEAIQRPPFVTRATGREP
jgi:pimeloyl-ACP methyl ester carboxylesterase